MLYIWYIDSSCNRNKIYTYATFKEYFQIVCLTNAMLYHTDIYIVELAIETMLSLSDMYHDTFTNRKKYNNLCRRLIKKSDRQIKHAYILFVKFLHTFLA